MIRTVRRYVSVVLAMVVLAAIAGAPAQAHITRTNYGHNWKKHYVKLAKRNFYTKAQADARFAPAGGGGGGSFWDLAGNAGTDPSVDFVGTTDDQALSFRVNGVGALRLDPAGSIPSVIGGHSENAIIDGVSGGSIGGGGGGDVFANRVTDHFGTIGGGQRNQAGDGAGTVGDRAHATIGGGDNNTASGEFSTIGGGATNTASGIWATVGGGQNNTATQQYATVAGGNTNTASVQQATVSGGRMNTASHQDSTVGGGHANTASGIWATVGGGTTNVASGSAATVGGGGGNLASGQGSTVPGGSGARATRGGEMAHASGFFVDAGDAQASEFVLRRITTNATQGELTLDSCCQRLVLDDGQTLAFEGLVAARSSTGPGQSAGYRIRGVIKNVGGTTSLVGAPTVETLGEDNAAWDVDVVANDALDALVIRATGVAATTIRWVASVRATQVAF